MNIDILNITTFAETPQLRTVVDLFDIANAVATILIGLVGFIISRSVKHRNDRELRAERRALRRRTRARASTWSSRSGSSRTRHTRTTRALASSSANSRRRNVARRPRFGEDDGTGPRPAQALRLGGDLRPLAALRGVAPSRALRRTRLLRALRPCAHLIGGEHGTLGLDKPSVDPTCFRLRLTLQALAMYWDPKSTRANELSQEEIEARRDNCTDAIKAFVKDAYADGDEWSGPPSFGCARPSRAGRFAAVPKAAGPDGDRDALKNTVLIMKSDIISLKIRSSSARGVPRRSTVGVSLLSKYTASRARAPLEAASRSAQLRCAACS